MSESPSIECFQWNHGERIVRWISDYTQIHKVFEWSVVHALPAKTKSLVGVIERKDGLPLTRATIWKEDGQMLIVLRMPESEPIGAIFYYFTQASEGFEMVTVSSTGDKRWAIDLTTGELSCPQFTL